MTLHEDMCHPMENQDIPRSCGLSAKQATSLLGEESIPTLPEAEGNGGPTGGGGKRRGGGPPTILTAATWALSKQPTHWWQRSSPTSACWDPVSSPQLNALQSPASWMGLPPHQRSPALTATSGPTHPGTSQPWAKVRMSFISPPVGKQTSLGAPACCGAGTSACVDGGELPMPLVGGTGRSWPMQTRPQPSRYSRLPRVPHQGPRRLAPHPRLC